jgi:uncharacterized membrane protein YdcZ (DUF606 family)
VRRAEAALDRIDPRALLAVAVAASGILLLVLLSHLTFFGDDWDPLLFRRGFNLDVLLRPHAEHILLGPTLIYKGIQATIGMEKLLPYAVVSTASFLASVVLLFVYLRRRVDQWLALAGVLPVLFMGTATEVLLWPFEVSFTASMAAGIGALLTLERGDQRGDAIACGLLVFSLAFSELALSFALGAAVAMVIARRPWSRCYAVIVPILLYALWYAGWGHTAESHLSLRNVVHSPIYLLKGLAASASALLGVPNSIRASIAEGHLPLVPLIVAALIPLAAAVLLRKRSRIPLPAPFWSSLVVLLSFWLFTAASYIPGRSPWASRYQYVGGVLLLMVLASLASGIRMRGAAILTALAVGGLAAISNLRDLHEGYQTLADLAARERGALAAFEVGGASADPGFTTGPANTDITSLGGLQVGPYLSAVDAFGSPTYGASELAGASEAARVAADQLLADAEELRLVPVARPPRPAGAPPRVAGPEGGAAALKGSCLTASGAGGTSPPIDLPRPGVTVTTPAGAAETVELRRFASSFPVRFQLRGSGVLLIRSDRSPQPWQLRLSGPGPTRICGIGPVG